MAKEIWASAHFLKAPAEDTYSYPPALAQNAEAYMVFMLPFDYSSMEILDLYLEPSVTKAAWDIDIALYGAAEGEELDHHQQEDTTSTYATTAAVLNVIDLKTLLATVVAQLAAGDVVQISVKNSETPPGVLTVLGVRIKYG